MSQSVMKRNPIPLSFNESKVPSIVNSVTEDDDDSSKSEERKEIYKVETYLRLYETMINREDEENRATLLHLLPILEILEKNLVADNSHDGQDDFMRWTREFQYSDFKNALKVIKEDTSYDFIATDRQWMMIMGMFEEEAAQGDQFISICEILQCYKICVVAMQTLQKVPTQNRIRKRIRERSLLMMDLFRPLNFNNVHEALKVDSPMECKPIRNGRPLNEPKTNKEANKRNNLRVFNTFSFCSLITLIMALVMSSIYSQQNQPNSRPEPNVLGPGVFPPHEVTSSKGMDPNSRFIHAPIPRLINSPATVPLVSKAKIRVAEPVINMSIQRPFQMPHHGPHQSSDSFRTAAASSKTYEEKSVDRKADIFSEDRLVLAAAVGGSAAFGWVIPSLTGVSTLLPAKFASLLPVGLTVGAATLIAHGIRDLVSSFRSRMKKRSFRR